MGGLRVSGFPTLTAHSSALDTTLDLGSFNGTLVDGERQPEITLTDGMVINVGKSTLVWWTGSQESTDPNRPKAPAPATASAPTDPRTIIKGLSALIALLAAALIASLLLR